MKLTSKDKLIIFNLKDKDRKKLWIDYIEQNLKKSKIKGFMRLKSKIKNLKILMIPSILKLEE